ncbi:MULTISPECIES: hypothetical protein [Yersinia]|uniref:hypothetical protein n=1 Tax=Yersinia TaxID=629 RepID=UPI0008FE88EA|nr:MULTISPECIES: hypothetical protein [Yersinia]EKN3637344.1 hypothetical protein [Yersinia enterocolitica]ELI8281190.1 hypothetical protein [Yersinia enterocolitica]MCB5314338.1 hypothetical protein [Yersinia intermedia]MCB5324753.1 hypothetical protein [Yersinia intermedia]MCB5328371.1 hypothetical protein [Yersinia intermedia]
MNTQNVNTATKESSERWVENRLNYAISEQKSLLMRLEELKNMRMMADERAELVMGTLMRMADNVLYPGITDWQESPPRVSFSVMQPWLQARTLVERLFGDTGAEAWAYARKHIVDSVAAEPHMP